MTIEKPDFGMNNVFVLDNECMDNLERIAYFLMQAGTVSRQVTTDPMTLLHHIISEKLMEILIVGSGLPKVLSEESAAKAHAVNEKQTD